MRIVIEANSAEIVEVLSHKEVLIHLFSELKAEGPTADDEEITNDDFVTSMSQNPASKTTYDEIESCNNDLVLIRKYRLQNGWTQTQLAERLGLTKGAIGMWETGERKPNVIMLKKLAQLLGCTTDDLLKDISIEN